MDACGPTSAIRISAVEGPGQRLDGRRGEDSEVALDEEELIQWRYGEPGRAGELRSSAFARMVPIVASLAIHAGLLLATTRPVAHTAPPVRAFTVELQRARSEEPPLPVPPVPAFAALASSPSRRAVPRAKGGIKARVRQPDEAPGQDTPAGLPAERVAPPAPSNPSGAEENRTGAARLAPSAEPPPARQTAVEDDAEGEPATRRVEETALSQAPAQPAPKPAAPSGPPGSRPTGLTASVGQGARPVAAGMGLLGQGVGGTARGPENPTPKASGHVAPAGSGGRGSDRQAGANQGLPAGTDPTGGEDGIGESAESQGVQGYVSAVRARIETAKLYPRWARRQGLSGNVTIAFRLGRGGELSLPRVLLSSGAPVLDEAALQAVRQAAPFPRFPGKPSRLPEELTVVIVFELR